MNEKETELLKKDEELSMMTEDKLEEAWEKMSTDERDRVCMYQHLSVPFIKKHQKEIKAKQVKVDVKEIRFGPQTDDHDYNFKLKHAQGFLSDGDKVKAYVFFKGRSILFKEQGEVLLLRFAADLEDYGKVEQMPQLEGKRMIMFIAPKKQPSQAKKILESTAQEMVNDKPKEKKAPQQKARKEYTGPKVEGEDFDD